jgi:hypothetical protein
MRRLMLVPILLLLSACSIDPCSLDKSSPTCDTRRSEAQATISAIDSERELRATDAAVYLAGQATKSAISSQATRQVVDAAATHSAMNTQATRQAISAQSTQSAVLLSATQTSIDADATKIAISTGAIVERARIESDAMPASARINIALFWFILPILIVFAFIIYGRRTIHAATQSISQSLSKRAALVTYGPANNPQMALVLFGADNQPLRIVTTEGLIGPYAELGSGQTVLDQLDVPDPMKLAALVESSKRSQAARIAAATGHSPWTTSVVYDQPASPPSAAPTPVFAPVPSFAELLRTWKPQPDRMLFGLDQSGPLYGRLDQLLSVIIVGRQGMGKTNLLRFIYAQCLIVGADVNAWDIHEDIIADLPGAQMFTSPESIESSTQTVIAELNRRIATGEKRTARPLMTLIDELNSLAYAVPGVVPAIARIVTEGRKYNIYCVVSCKGAPAEEFGKSYIRDAFSARYAFNTTTRQAAMVGFDREDVQQVRTLEIGQALLDGPVPSRLVRIPLVTSDDVQRLLPASHVQNEPLRPLRPTSPEVDQAEVLRHSEATPEVASEVDPKRQKIAEMLREGASRNAIIKEVYGVTGGEKYQSASAKINQIQKELLSC